MPSKIQLDENLWFLYVCLQKSDYKTIDFNAVGQVTNLNPPAARMRFTRLKRNIENGALIGTHGTPFVAGPKEKTSGTPKKRKSTAGVNSGKTKGYEGDEEERLEELGPVVKMRTRGNRVRVKLEDEEGEVGYLSSGGSSEYGDRDGEADVDTEDEFEEQAPLSKRRRSMGIKKKGADASTALQTITKAVERSTGGGLAKNQSTALSHAQSPGPHGSTLDGIQPQLDTNVQNNHHARDLHNKHAFQQPGVQPPVTSLQNCTISSEGNKEVPSLRVVPKAELDHEGF